MSNLTADVDLFIYQGAQSVTAGGEVCSSRLAGTAAESCVGTSDANGEMFIHIAAANADYTINITNGPAITPRDITGLLTLPDEVNSWLSQYYVVTGLVPNSTHTINLIHGNEDADLYIYDNVQYGSPTCSSVAASVDETCQATASANGEIFIRVFGFDRVIVPITYTLQIQ